MAFTLVPVLSVTSTVDILNGLDVTPENFGMENSK